MMKAIFIAIVIFAFVFIGSIMHALVINACEDKEETDSDIFNWYKEKYDILDGKERSKLVRKGLLRGLYYHKNRK